MLTDARIGEIKERLSKATPNRWKFVADTNPPSVCYEVDVYYRCGEVERTEITLVEASQDTSACDMEFIAHSHADITDLLAAHDEQRQRIEELTGLLRKNIEFGRRSSQETWDEFDIAWVKEVEAAIGEQP